MFDYISGKLVQKTNSYAVIETGGIGYRIFSTLSSLEQIGEVGGNAKLYTYLNIKNASDILALYGFSTQEERKTFEMILGVSGVGAKTAASVLSNISTSKFALCVIAGDSKYIASHTPGLGPKGAQRIVLELKDKFRDVEIGDIAPEEFFADITDGTNEALSALVVLGYSKSEAEKALAGSSGTVEDRIKQALKKLI